MSNKDGWSMSNKDGWSMSNKDGWSMSVLLTIARLTITAKPDPAIMKDVLTWGPTILLGDNLSLLMVRGQTIFGGLVLEAVVKRQTGNIFNNHEDAYS